MLILFFVGCVSSVHETAVPKSVAEIVDHRRVGPVGRRLYGRRRPSITIRLRVGRRRSNGSFGTPKKKKRKEKKQRPFPLPPFSFSGPLANRWVIHRLWIDDDYGGAESFSKPLIVKKKKKKKFV